MFLIAFCRLVRGLRVVMSLKKFEVHRIFGEIFCWLFKIHFLTYENNPKIPLLAFYVIRFGT